MVGMVGTACWGAGERTELGELGERGELGEFRSLILTIANEIRSRSVQRRDMTVPACLLLRSRVGAGLVPARLA